MKSKYILSALIYAISGVPAADANAAVSSDSPECERLRDQLDQFADDTNSAMQGSTSDTQAHECFTVIELQAQMTALSMETIILLLNSYMRATNNDANDAKFSLSQEIRTTESLLTDIRKPISFCSPDSAVVATRQKLLQLVDRASYCIAILKVRVPPATPPVSAQLISP